MKSFNKIVFIYYVLLSSIPMHMNAWCGYIVRNETDKDGSRGGTIEVYIQKGNTEAAEKLVVLVGEQEELTSHDSPICPNPRLIQINGTDGDIRTLSAYYEPNNLGTFHKMVITVRNLGYGLADKTQRKLVVDITELNKAKREAA